MDRDERVIYLVGRRCLKQKTPLIYKKYLLALIEGALLIFGLGKAIITDIQMVVGCILNVVHP
jgi:hypothetical protein